ncbi:MAG: HAD-IA family hydrolase [Proteobacteria bacterium]|nr:HAD-IA family hydrolase [Pseudomonadota bacterium]MBS0415863.1 HAD-IA family hydrolase [Pseudomonadota bacterium]
MIDARRIRAITLDLDDTLWPVWPTIQRADQALRDWLAARAPRTAALAADGSSAPQARRAVLQARPELTHDLGAIRLEVIRQLLRAAGDDPALAEPAFEVFYRERQRVTLFDDALPALDFLAARYPLVALSNGNADVGQVGLARYFRAAVSAASAGVAKPDARIFHTAAQAAGVTAGAVLHIGDDAELDAAGALGAGMQTAWVNRADVAWPPGHAEAPQAVVRDLAALCRLLSST